jgi:hypothetical protein
MRFDFLALSDDRRLVVVEIKRAGHAVTLEELQRLEMYKERLSKGEDKDLHMLLVHGGSLDVTDSIRQNWRDRHDGEIRTWSEVQARVRNHYEHYRAVLEGNVSDGGFAKKQREVAQTRSVLEHGAYRDAEARSDGLGPQDNEHLLSEHEDAD